ncbi:ABC transporter permease [Rhodococcus sp. BP-252]|uniref:ABC transporter permease n=1 Tax=unclassified Rhodococcus (in: high G+C Gram-positive bacteria) TaxID=192944 RepID=UPI000DF203BA|nr:MULTISPECIES: ABC transporter permease [unclassified Rhodococcus (in: high G+C Gram-positive bacteria)]MBY6412024.1 ABC transporter permease [Rhodococcus sp. BP-320]MBY6416604.1 ABC transporter permease [Rhodococcus sp. BP-321]MBY6421207.1 ABC transporter permease [Rhodococcus sp. BP-324]MBY6426628.1 ABC transporter permease [Rhodococcus sp. BP-323]MBY6431627.1 ABC transporter permease [Rhodococcus sp. BP-322]
MNAAVDIDIRTTTAAAQGAAAPEASTSQWRLGLRTFCRDKVALVSAIFLILVALAAIFAPMLTSYSPIAGDPVNRLAGIGTDGHILGLDGQGRDILARLLYGGRNSLLVAVIPVLVVFPLALLIGLFAGYKRSRAGEVLMRVLDVLFAFPLVLLAIALSAVLGAGLGNVMLSIGVTLVPYMARVAYTATVQEASKEYIEAARAYGANPGHLMFRELAPNVVAQLIVYATTLCGLMIVVAAGLSFLGVGVVPPTPDWGIMTSDGSSVLLEGIYHIATIPGLVILFVALAFNLVGDGIRDALDPRKQTR